MDEMIKNALIILLNNELIVASWGISNIAINESSFEFVVSGFIYQGKVSVSIKNSNYLITFENGCSVECNINDLVHCLDSKIEKTSDYEKVVLKWIDGQCLHPEGHSPSEHDCSDLTFKTSK
jgi:hypothetical protein